MIHFSNVSSKFGAPLGRRSGQVTGKVRLERVRLNSGGYDRGGAYWGIGEPLWVAEDSEGERTYLRAPERSEAKRRLPGCTFYR